MNRWRLSLRSEWLKYLIVIVLSVGIWAFAFGMYHAPRAYEKISLFFAGNVKNYMFENLAEERFGDLRQVSIVSSDPADKTFVHKYELVAFNDSDVVIVPESIAAQTYCEESFIEMTVEGELYYQEGIAYGVYLPASAQTALGEYFAFTEERYVVMIPGSSVNGGYLTDHAIAFTEWLTHYVQA